MGLMGTTVVWMGAGLGLLQLLQVVIGQWRRVTWRRVLELAGLLLLTSSSLGWALTETGWSLLTAVAALGVLEAAGAAAVFIGFCRRG